MYKDETVAVVVPAYNEEKLIGRVIESMPTYVDQIIIVDDCSTDKTADIVESYKKRSAHDIILLRHEKNKGVGGAISTGYKYAREKQFDLTAVMAGDAQMDPEDLILLLDPVADGDADYAKGNRLFTGEAWQKIPHVRYIGNAILSLLTKVASGYWHVADSQTGYTVSSLKVLQTLDLDKVLKRYGMPNDFLVRLNIYGFRVTDVPIQSIYGIGEQSGIHCGKAIPRFLWLLGTLFLWRMKEKYIIRDFHPLVFFYLMGFICAPIGFFHGIYLLYLRLTDGPVVPTSALFAAFLFLIGIQSIFFGMWMDVQHGQNNGIQK